MALTMPAASARTPAPSHTAWQRVLSSVRVRTAAAALSVVAVALIVGAAGMFVLLYRSLEGSIEQSARLQASEIGALVRRGTVPSPLPGAPYQVQVVAAGGRIVAASSGETEVPVFANPSIAHGTVAVQVLSRLPFGAVDLFQREGPYIVVRQSVRSPQGWVTVEVMASLDTLREVLARLAQVLGVGLPLLALLVGAMAWVLAGKALRPVEEMRREVADITASDLHRRVAEPPSADEIARLASTMNAMLDRLERAATRQRRFVSDASHELRTPLTVLQAQLEVALAHPDGAWPAVAWEALEEAQQMGRLVEDLLVLARADEAPAPAPLVAVDLDDLVLAEGHRLRAQRGLIVDEHGVGAARVMGRPDQLRRVVRNLCDNASQWAHGVVRLELRTREGWAELVVSDDGPGIPPDQRDRIFERFARVEESRSKSSGGTGLGLAIVRELVVAHGGSVRAGPPGGPPVDGARIVVRLPAMDVPSVSAQR